MATVKHEKYQRLIDTCKALPPTPTAVAHPCDASSLEGAMAAARLGLIVPILVGPARAHPGGRRRRTASTSPASRSSMRRTARPPPTAAVQLVREGKAEALMKGSLHTDELMAAVVRRETGLRTARRVSHCFVMDVPGRDEGLIITDAAVNIAPTLEDKVDILQNAIDLAHAMGIADVRVAMLSAMETINSKVPSTIEAAALCKMMDRAPGHRRARSTARWRSTTPSIPKRRASRRSIRRWPAAPTSCWCRTSKPATCSPRA